MKSIRRKISWLLLLAMLVSMFSVGAYAEGEALAVEDSEVVETVETQDPVPEVSEPEAVAEPEVETETEVVPAETVESETVEGEENADELAAPPPGGGSDDHVFRHIDVRINGAELPLITKVIDLATNKVIDSSTSSVKAYVTAVNSVVVNGTTYTGFTNSGSYEFRKTSGVEIKLSTVNVDTAYAIMNVDLIDAEGRTYNNVSVKVGKTGIMAAATNCDGYRGGTSYDGLDFELDKDAATIESVEYIKKVVSVSKVWNDNDDQDGLRPDSITVQLYANGTAVSGSTLTLNAANSWAGQFENLSAADSSGNAITYTVQETEVPTGYTVSYNGNVITNTHTPEYVSVSGTKTWVDGDDQDGIRPDSIGVTLYANRKPIALQTVSAETDWKYAFTNLPKYADGKEILYSVSESPVEGYTVSFDGYDIINTHAPELVDIRVQKQWVDGNDQDGKRPDSITVKLLADGVEVEGATATVTAEDGWVYTFSGYPKYADGELITYTVEEEAVGDYTATYDGYVITNTREPEKTSVTVTKAWADNDDQDGIRPGTVSVNLLADNVVVQTATVTAESGWTYTFGELPKYSAGTEIVYTVEEAAVVDGYTDSVDGYTITNTHTPETIDVSGSKTWDDNNDQDGKRPESITVNLLADGVEIDSVTVTEADGWAWSFTDLDKYAAGDEIDYTVTEDEVTFYTSDVDGYDITNSHTPEVIDISGSKTWDDADDQDGIRPEEITVSLLANGEVVAVAVADAESGWAYAFEDMPKYSDGVEIEYTVSETPVEGYDATVTGYDISNKHVPEVVDVTITKRWEDASNQDGKHPTEIQVTLYADGAEVDTYTLTAAAGWTLTVEGLDKYADGVEIEYTVVETPVDGYEAAYDGTIITNTHDLEKTEVTVTKTWDDADDQDGKRPEAITVTLLADGVEYTSATFGSAEGWTYTFENLPKYAEGKEGVEVVYTVSEADVEGYTSVVDGFAITNTHVPEVTAVHAVKEWDDNDNQDGIRPESVEVVLYKTVNRVKTEVGTYTISEETGWELTVEDLPVYEAGVLVVYSIEETAVAGYEASYENAGTDMLDVTITNTHAPEVMDVTVEKVWKDNDDKNEKRPDEITVQLYADGEAYGDPVVVKADESGDWSHIFKDLPVYADGKAVVYTVKEEGVKYYVAKYSDMEDGVLTITNVFVDIPLTGDTMNTILWSLLGASAALALAVVSVTAYGFKKKLFSK